MTDWEVGQVFGCEFYPAMEVREQVDANLFLGQSNFHAAGVAISTKVKTYILDPYFNEVRDVTNFAEKLEKKATLKIYKAMEAKVFGVISANTKIIKVKTIDPITTPLSPNKFKQRTVVSEAARIFTKLFPMRITPSNLSGLFKSLSALIAPLSFSLTKYLRRYLFKDIIAVSTPEKKAERNSRKTMLENSIQGLTSVN